MTTSLTDTNQANPSQSEPVEQNDANQNQYTDMEVPVGTFAF